MRARFAIACDFILQIEGGYVADPDDAGGETNFGISKRSYPDLDIRNLTRAEAAAIYERDYWRRYRCGELPAGLDVALFDAAVQHRPASAVTFLQVAVGAPADGVMGPVTIAHAASCERAQALIAYFAERTAFYMDLMVMDSRRVKFRRGWFARMFRLHAFILRTLED